MGFKKVSTMNLKQSFSFIKPLQNRSFKLRLFVIKVLIHSLSYTLVLTPCTIHIWVCERRTFWRVWKPESKRKSCCG